MVVTTTTCNRKSTFECMKNEIENCEGTRMNLRYVIFLDDDKAYS